MSELIEIDGREGEGGGQVVRTALSLSAATGQPVRIVNVRGKRKKPGLLRQHLTALRAVREISDGRVEGDELGSAEICLWPGRVQAGDYRFGIGSAGSTTLVLQTVLPPLMLADGPSRIVLEGGTHNPMAPPFEFLRDAFAPLVGRAGARLDLELVRPGFAPSGGGELHATIHPAVEPRPLELLERGAEGRHRCTIGLAQLPADIAEREWDAFRRRLPWTRDRLVVTDMPESVGPGNVMSVQLAFEHVTEIQTVFGARGVSGRRLGGQLASSAKRFLAGDAPVGRHLADQLMVPLALLAGGRYRTAEPTEHTRTNAAVIGRFLPGAVELEGSTEDITVVVKPLG